MDGETCKALDAHIKGMETGIRLTTDLAGKALDAELVDIGKLASAVRHTDALVASKETLDRLHDEATRIAEQVLDTGDQFRSTRSLKGELERLELIYTKTCGARPPRETL